MWGVFEYDESIHVIPCNEEGEKYPPHIGDEFCVCHPEIEDGGNRLIVKHNQIH